MSSDPRSLSPAELVLFMQNAATAVADGKVTGFLAAQNTSISDALTDAATELSTDNTDVVTKDDAASSAREKRRESVETAIALLSDLRQGMHSVNSPGEQFESVGF